MTYLQNKQEWKLGRLESKTGFLPMTNAIMYAHDSVKPYHYSNEVNMINKIILGMNSKAFKQKHGIQNIRDAMNADQLEAINRLQIINTGLIEIGWEYHERKAELLKCHERGISFLNHPVGNNEYLEVS